MPVEVRRLHAWRLSAGLSGAEKSKDAPASRQPCEQCAMLMRGRRRRRLEDSLMFPLKDAFKAMVGDAGSSGYFDIGTIRIQ